MKALVSLLAGVSRRAPVVVVLTTVALTAVLGMLSTQQELEQSQESFSPDNPRLNASEFAEEAFEGSTDTVVQVVVSGGDVVSPEGLRTVRAVTDTLRQTVPEEQLADGRRSITSYLAPLQQAIAEGRISPERLSDPAAFDRAFARAREETPPRASGLADRLIATDEGEAATDADEALMLLSLDTDAIAGEADRDEATSEVVAVVSAIVEEVEALDTPLEANAFAFELFFEPGDEFTDEVARLFASAAAIIVVILFLVYLFPPRGDASWARVIRRTGADVALTLFAILASIVWMQGIGVLLGPEYTGLIGAFTPPTQIVPILLIGLGVDFAIHLTSRNREELAGGVDVSGAADRAIKTVGVALALATTTTALGFLTNVVNPVPAISDFGVLAAVGIVVAFLLMLTFVPAVRLLLDRRAEGTGRLPREALGGSSRSRLSRLTASASVLAERTSFVVLGVTLLLGGLGWYGLTQLSTEFSFADFVEEGNPVRETFLTIENEFTGGFGERSQIVIDGRVATPTVHNATVAGQAELAGLEGVVTVDEQAVVQSVVTAIGGQLRLAALAQGGGGDGSPAVSPDAPPAGGAAGGAPDGVAGGAEQPVSPEQVAAAQQFARSARQLGLQPDLTVSEGTDVSALYDALLEADPSAAASLARRDGGYVASQLVVQTQSREVGPLELAERMERAFAPAREAGVEVTATGNAIISQAIVDDLSSSQVSSLIVTLLAALLLLVVVFGLMNRRPELGVITVLPVGLVILWVFGTMAATGIPFGPVTSTISGLAIGIGVPYSIHITHRFLEDLEDEPDLEAALQSTMRHTGGALAGSALTTMAGFLILVTSSLVPFRQLGLVVAYAIGYSLLAAIIVLPSLLALWARFRPRRETERLVTRRAKVG